MGEKGKEMFANFLYHQPGPQSALSVEALRRRWPWWARITEQRPCLRDGCMRVSWWHCKHDIDLATAWRRRCMGTNTPSFYVYIPLRCPLFWLLLARKGKLIKYQAMNCLQFHQRQYCSRLEQCGRLGVAVPGRFVNWVLAVQAKSGRSLCNLCRLVEKKHDIINNCLEHKEHKLASHFLCCCRLVTILKKN